MTKSKDTVSSYTKLTAQDLSQQFMLPVSAHAAKSLFDNPAFSNMIQPILMMLQSQALLEKAVSSCLECQKLLGDFLNIPLGLAKDEQGADRARERIFKDNTEIAAATKEIMALGSILSDFQEETQSFIDAQLVLLRQDLDTLQDMVEALRNEVAADYASTLLDKDLAASIFAALYNPNTETQLDSITKDLKLNLNNPSPLKKALIVGIVNNNPQQADATKLEKILNASAVERYQDKISEPTEYKNTEKSGQLTSQYFKTMAETLEKEISNTEKKLRQLAEKTTADCNEYAAMTNDQNTQPRQEEATPSEELNEDM